MFQRLLGGIARHVEQTRHPRRLLLLVIAVLYGPSLAQPFFVDDYRNLRLIEEYDRGQRPRLGLYEFIRDARDNADKRARGELLWWVGDDMHFCYLRPVPERLIHWQYHLFGRTPQGYRVVSLLLYAIDVCTVLALFRRWGLNETTARWAAILFTVAASNTLSITFIAQQCDLLALLGVVASLLAVANFAEGRGPAWLLASLAWYLLALFSKEAAVPAAVLPLALLIARADRPANPLRTARIGVATLACLALVAGYILYHGHHGYGSNSVMMLDPLHAPIPYLKALPLRAAALLTSWLLPINPVLVYTGGRIQDQLVFVAAGLVFLLPLLAWLRPRIARDCRLRAFGLWTIPFLPVLACTVPDSRIMMLPTIGLSVLGAVWLRRDDPPLDAAPTDLPPASAPAGGLRGIAFGLLIVAQVLAGIMAQYVNVTLERNCGENLRAAVAGFERPTRRDDCIYFFNTHWMLDTLWSYDRLLHLDGPEAPYVTYLSHLMNVEPEVIGPRTLRLHAAPDANGVIAPFFTTPAAVGVMTGSTVEAGWTSRMKEFTATVRKGADGCITTIDLEFIDRLDSPRYRFYFLVPGNLPLRWQAGGGDRESGIGGGVEGLGG